MTYGSVNYSFEEKKQLGLQDRLSFIVLVLSHIREHTLFKLF